MRKILGQKVKRNEKFIGELVKINRLQIDHSQKDLNKKKSKKLAITLKRIYLCYVIG